METQERPFVVNVRFEGATEEEQPPDTVAYAFDPKGRFLDSAPVREGQAKLALPDEMMGRSIRVVLGPRLEKRESPTLAALTRLGGYEKRLRVDPENPTLDLTLLKPDWLSWLLCACVVRGRLVKRITLPDGSIQELPICHARVTICEVDRLPKIIWRLPDDLLYRLRDELLEAIRRPIPIPPPPPDPFREIQISGPAPSPEVRRLSENITLSRPAQPASFAMSAQPVEPQMLGSETQTRLHAIATTTSALELRSGLVSLADLIRPYLCLWDWLDPFFYYWVDCITTVMVDENGRFETTIYYPCFGDKPDLYFKAEQLHGFIWESIYAPSVRCHTHWNYECGSEVVINVTSPSAIPCAPDDPVDPPPGLTSWVMPFAVGGSKIWGTPPMAPPAPTGWVKTDGKTDYGGIVDAPFGGHLGFRHGFSNNIPSAAMKYYRWSYRKGGAGEWKHMSEPVSRHYVKQSPGMLPTFPAYPLGPHTVGSESELYEFKPHFPPGPGGGDPPGTVTYWPTDDWFGDIYTGFLNTPALPPNVAGAAGQYQVKLEVFDEMGNLVAPGGGTFQFIVPTGVDVDGVTILSREAQPVEIDASGFVFNLHIDNNTCDAAIDAPTIGLTATADECGFLRYDPTSSTPVTIAFHATHPNNHATFGFSMVRGATNLPGAGASGEVAALSAGPYAGDGTGNFTDDFALSELMCGPVDPTDCCTNAAFAEHLHVYAKATTGWGTRISSYDAADLRAFALAPEES